ASGQLALDSSSNSNHGYLRSALSGMWQPTGGVSGGALHFDGTPYESFVVFPSATGSCPNPISISGSFTASAHVRFEAFGDWGTYSLSDVVLMHGTNGGNEGGWGLGATNGCGDVPRVGVTVSATFDAIRTTRCGTTQLTTGVWHHIVGVYDAPARSLEVYLNGVLDTGAMTPNSLAIPSQIFTPDACPYMGASANQAALLRGSVDNARLYTRALPATDIAALFAQGG
nr:LamG domain-containing protein [Deltaproteobacteria bacterium]